MPAYFIADLDVHDPAGFEEYRKLVPETIQRYGGRYLVRGGKHETLEGTWQAKRLVVVEFPSAEAAKRWYECEEYEQLKPLRMRAARTNLILVQGI